MTRSLWFMWVVVLAVGGTGIALAGRNALTSQKDAAVEVQRFSLLVDQASTLSRLRSTRPAWADSSGNPETGLAPRVSAVLASCGLPPSTLGSLSPETE